MNHSVIVTSAEAPALLPWRELYRREMACQIIHDSFHQRSGWTQSYFLQTQGQTVGDGSIVLGGPWVGKPTVFEFYVLPAHRLRLFDLFEALLHTCKAVRIDTQTNDPLLTVLLHSFATEILCEKILFRDHLSTSLPNPNAQFRPVAESDRESLEAQDLDADAGYLLEVEGTIAAAGGILFHYNPPNGDIYMKVAEPFRRQGLGSFLVQELKRACYDLG